MTTMTIERAQRAPASPTQVPPLPLLPPPVRPTLAAIWQDLLDRRPCGSDDFFRDHRGNAIESLQLLLEVRRRFGVEVRMRDFVQDSTFDALVRAVTAGRNLAPLCVLGL